MIKKLSIKKVSKFQGKNETGETSFQEKLNKLRIPYKVVSGELPESRREFDLIQYEKDGVSKYAYEFAYVIPPDGFAYISLIFNEEKPNLSEVENLLKQALLR